MTTEDIDREYKRGLALVRKYGPYVVQQRLSDGSWANVDPRGICKGIEAAKKYMKEYAKKHPRVSSHDLRCVPKIVSDTMRETINIIREQEKRVVK